MENKELIKDKRLHSGTKRTRNGSTQEFNDKRSGSYFELKHENKEMYAKLIDNKWYWVNGCYKCNPEESKYIICKKHDICDDCGEPRTKFKDAVWGTKDGWCCNPCMDERNRRDRIDAFEKLNGEEPDCNYMDKIICPHCGSEICNDDEHESRDMDCSICEGEFSLQVDYTASYTTQVKGERITE